MHPYYCMKCSEPENAVWHHDDDEKDPLFDAHLRYRFVVPKFDSAMLMDGDEK